MSLICELKDLYPEMTVEQLQVFTETLPMEKRCSSDTAEIGLKIEEKIISSFDRNFKIAEDSSIGSENGEEQSFENFVENMKTPVVPKSVHYSSHEMKNWLVNDDDNTSDSDSSPTFYLKSLNERIARRKNKPVEDMFSFERFTLKCNDQQQNSCQNENFPVNYNSSNFDVTPPSVLTFIPKNTPKSVKKSGRIKIATPIVDKLIKTDAEFATVVEFLDSLSVHNNKTQPLFVTQFRKMKNALVAKLFNIFNKYVFESQLPIDMQITWNVRLTKTAGYCYYKKGMMHNNNNKRISRIELSDKVCDSAERVRDTLIHELCHAAVWLLNGVKSNHGPLWKKWARKAQTKFPSLPAITRCHSYEINAKFTYRCVSCKYEIHRHSKSLDINTKVCGYCKSSFELVPRKTTVSKTPNPPKFALFVQENYNSIKKSSDQNSSHKQIMRLLSEQFKEQLRFTVEDDDS